MQDLQHFKLKLESLKAKHHRRLDSIDSDIRHEGMSADWAEQATERENDEVLESLGNASEMELLKINRALKRIQSGDYFICSECGEQIPSERLELLPFTTHCVNCAEILESKD